MTLAYNTLLVVEQEECLTYSISITISYKAGLLPGSILVYSDVTSLMTLTGVVTRD